MAAGGGGSVTEASTACELHPRPYTVSPCASDAPSAAQSATAQANFACARGCICGQGSEDGDVGGLEWSCASAP